jgi:hypothetical protein
MIYQIKYFNMLNEGNMQIMKVPFKLVFYVGQINTTALTIFFHFGRLSIQISIISLSLEPYLWFETIDIKTPVVAEAW